METINLTTNNIHHINNDYYIIRKSYNDEKYHWDDVLYYKWEEVSSALINSPIEEYEIYKHYLNFLTELEKEKNHNKQELLEALSSPMNIRKNKWLWYINKCICCNHRFDIWFIRENLEPLIDTFLPDIIIETRDNSFACFEHWDEKEIMNTYFFLDNTAINRLKDNWYSHRFLEIKDRLFETLEITKLIAENLWNTLYSTFTDFLHKLWNQLNSEEITQASNSIQKARQISEKYMDKNNIPPTHKNAEDRIKNIGWIDKILEDIWKLQPSELSQFLTNLSEKIRADWDNDLYNWREKLSDYLHLASNYLQTAWNLFKK